MSDEQDEIHVNHPPPKIPYFDNKDSQGTILQDETDQKSTSIAFSDDIEGVAQ